MRDIEDVIEEHENMVKNTESRNALDKSDEFRKLHTKMKMLAKLDVCKNKYIAELNDYRRIKDFTNFILFKGRYYYLYMKYYSDNLEFISTSSSGTGITRGTALNIDHVSEEDIVRLTGYYVNKVNTTSDKNVKVNNIIVIGFVIALYGLFTSIYLMILGGIIIFAFKKNNTYGKPPFEIVKQKIEDFFFYRVKGKPILQKIQERISFFQVKKTKKKNIEKSKKPKNNRRKKRERY